MNGRGYDHAELFTCTSNFKKNINWHITNGSIIIIIIIVSRRLHESALRIFF